MTSYLYVFLAGEIHFLQHLSPSNCPLSKNTVYTVYEAGNDKPVGTLSGWEFTITGSTFTVFTGGKYIDITFKK